LLDQFGVLHDGKQPYPGAISTCMHIFPFSFLFFRFIFVFLLTLRFRKEWTSNPEFDCKTIKV
jgi:hypothetical protein